MSAQNPGGTGATGSSTGSGGMPPSDQMSSPARRRTRQFGTGAAVGIAVLMLAVGIGGGYFLGSYLTKVSTSTIDITETGSTLLEPLMDIWGPNYTSTVNSHVILSPSGGGSGQGQSESEAGTIDIGASDAYTAANLGVVDVPVAISSQLVVYNLGSGFHNVHLNLNGSILGMIYTGKITAWNNPLIQAANPGVTLPSTTITPIYRGDSSGDTYIFTSYLYISWAGWEKAGYINATKAFLPPTGKAPVGGIPGTGNIGVIGQLENYSGGIGYVGISYQSDVLANSKLGVAALGDALANSAAGGNVTATPADGKNYINWSTANVSSDASLGLTQLNYAADGLAVSLIEGGSPAGATTWSPGGGGTAPTLADPNPYPITNLEYTLLKISPSSSSHQAYVVQFIQWAISYGNNVTNYLSKVGFIPLTPQLSGLDQEALAEVHISS